MIIVTGASRGIGAEIIRKLLSEMKVEKEVKKVKDDIEATKSDITKLKLLKRLQLLNALSFLWCKRLKDRMPRQMSMLRHL